MKREIAEKINRIFQKQSENFKFDWQTEYSGESRITHELSGYGPIESLLQNPEITEILVNAWDCVYFEVSGQLTKSDDHFFSEQTYHAALERLAQSCGTYLSREKPFVEAQLQNKRITIIFGEVSRGTPLLSIRVQPQISWTLAELLHNKFLTVAQNVIVEKILSKKNNFLVIGSTGSGKTSFMQALVNKLRNERLIIIEDTQELQLPCPLSVSLLTRQDPAQTVTDIEMEDLIKRALRLRPDRLIVGEIRGKEATALLQALATGHAGSFGSLHAKNAHEALLRLEMLIQMGAPQWHLNSIRKLIAMTVQYIFVVEKQQGTRKLKAIYEICSIEESGLTLTELAVTN